MWVSSVRLIGLGLSGVSVGVNRAYRGVAYHQIEQVLVAGMKLANENFGCWWPPLMGLS